MQISRKRFLIEDWYQLPTNRKWPLAIQMMTSSMTSRDLDRSRSWSQYLYGPLFWKWLEIDTRLQWGTYRKWHMRNRMVTWPMTSSDSEKSKSWPSYIYMQISRKQFEIEALYQLLMNRKWPMAIQMTTSSMTSRDLVWRHHRLWSRWVLISHGELKSWCSTVLRVINSIKLDVFTFFKKYPSRSEDFSKMQESLSMEKTAFKRFVNNRWLSVGQVCYRTRIIDNWDCLCKYFLKTDHVSSINKKA